MVRDPIWSGWAEAIPGETPLCAKWGVAVSAQGLALSQKLQVPRLSWRAALGDPDPGWGLPLLREVGYRLNSVPNGVQGDSGVTLRGTESDAQASPPPLAPVLTDIPRPGPTPAKIFIAWGFGCSSSPFSGEAGPWVEASGARVASALGGLSCCLGPQLAPFLPLPVQGNFL